MTAIAVGRKKRKEEGEKHSCFLLSFSFFFSGGETRRIDALCRERLPAPSEACVNFGRFYLDSTENINMFRHFARAPNGEPNCGGKIHSNCVKS